ncbi:hypothetical protein [Mycolicibacter minnesotensis]|nr:hypothetical protein [Mycolicibacter minnesotensis]BBY33350.1 hypothetical protein MMIN_14110 [Mycolicibacter minnesotensis]
MTTYDGLEHFTRCILDRYQPVMEDDAYWAACDALAAGELEIAAVTAVEMAPVTAAELDTLEVLAEHFDHVDGPIARHVVTAVRERIRAGIGLC